ncbi:MAG: molybdenum cofactor biosynthesis protein, partial [Nannocystaceae bacterium]
MSPPTTRSIRLFAGLKEQAGTPQLTLTCADGTTAADLRRLLVAAHPELAVGIDACRVAVGEKFVDEHERLPSDGQIALIPPVSGGQDADTNPPPADAPSRSRSACLTTEPLDPAAVAAEVDHEGAGATTSFTGRVRRQSRGVVVTHLEYEAYGPMALRVMQTIVDGIEASVEGARVAIHHRLGHLSVGEAAVVIAASAPHRAEAFDACRQAIEALKRDVPI